MGLIVAALTALGLGSVYFIAAIPAAMALHLPWYLAALFSWIGYTLGGFLLLPLGPPIKNALIRRFGVSLDRSRHKPFWFIWDHFGLPGMCLFAPVTIGPQVGYLLGTLLGVPTRRLIIGLALGAIPWSLGIALSLLWGWRTFAQ